MSLVRNLNDLFETCTPETANIYGRGIEKLNNAYLNSRMVVSKNSFFMCLNCIAAVPNFYFYYETLKNI